MCAFTLGDRVCQLHDDYITLGDVASLDLFYNVGSCSAQTPVVKSLSQSFCCDGKPGDFYHEECGG